MIELKNLPDSEYFAIDALSSSGIKQLLKSPKHFKTMGSFSATPAMRIGTCCHALLLGGLEEIAVFDGKGLTTKAAQEFKGEHKGKSIVLKSEMDLAETIVEAQQHKSIVKVFAETENEIAAVGDFDGVPVKAKADALHRKNKMIIDFKTTASVEAFKKNFFNFGYQIQAPWYTQLFNTVTPVEDFVFYVVETSPPYDSMIFRPTQEVLDYGYELIEKAFELYQKCRNSKQWHGYTQEIQDLDLPGWIRNTR